MTDEIRVLRSEKLPNGQTREIHYATDDNEYRVAVYTEDGQDWDWECFDDLPKAENRFSQVTNIDQLGQ